MINIVEKNLFDSKANFIVHQVNCQSIMGSGVAAQVAELFPHVEREYMKYLRYCKKNKIEPMGTAQYVPVDSWAVGIADTMKNNRVEKYDVEYQYIVNMFGQNNFGMGEMHTDLEAVRKAMEDIRDKAKDLDATVAMPYKISSHRGGADWNDMYMLIQDVFLDSGVDVEICKLDLN